MNKEYKDNLTLLTDFYELTMMQGYFKNNSNYLYSIIECVSGNAILHGQCVTGNLDKCKLLVSTKKDDIMRHFCRLEYVYERKN